MKKLILSLLLAVTVALSAQAKSLVVYFSWGEFHKAEVDATTSASVVVDGGAKYGTTELLAKLIAASTGADLWRIEPTEAYPRDYTPTTEVVKAESEKGTVRSVKGSPDFAKYESYRFAILTEFLQAKTRRGIGASLRSKLGEQPQVATHTAPTLVTNFLQEHRAELSGKTVIPFVTYWATYGKETLAALTEATPSAKHKDGLATSKPNKSEVAAWLKKIGEKN